jgi:Ca2+-dependent lipid-binding protein
LRQVETKVVKNTLAPAWEETFYILVQEPTTQMLKLELYDYDTISIKVLLPVSPMSYNRLSIRDVTCRMLKHTQF